MQAHLKRFWPAYLAGFGLLVFAASQDEEFSGAISDTYGEAVEIVKKYTGNSSIVHNNPGNIEYDGTAWVGADGFWVSSISGRKYCKFKTAFDGLRAMAIICLKYELSYSIYDLDSFGEKWAPAADNKGDSKYGARLAKYLKVVPDEYFSIIDNLPNLVRAIIKNENSVQPYDAALISSATSAAYAYKGLTAYV